jgi:hypothetical protein
MSLIIKKNTTFKIPRTGITISNVDNIIIISNAGGANGIYLKKAGNFNSSGCGGGLNILDYEGNASRCYFQGPRVNDDYSCTIYYLLGPFTSGSGYGGGNSVSPQGVWKIYSVYQDNETGYTQYTSEYVSTETNPSVIPTEGWSQNIKITIGPRGIPVNIIGVIQVVDNPTNFAGTYYKTTPDIWDGPLDNILTWTGLRWEFRGDNDYLWTYNNSLNQSADYIPTSNWVVGDNPFFISVTITALN